MRLAAEVYSPDFDALPHVLNRQRIHYRDSERSIGDRVLDLQAAQVDGRRAAPDTLLELIQQGPEAWKFAGEVAVAEIRLKPDSTYALDEVRWHAPIPRPLKNVFCVGRNYAAHAKESAAAFKTDAEAARGSGVLLQGADRSHRTV